MPIHKTKNENFFEKWSPKMAYVLGFFTADGYMIKNKRGAHFIEFESVDKEIISKIKNTLNTNIKISHCKSKNINYKEKYRLQIGSKKLFNDLLKLGLTSCKSKTITLPKIPQKYFSHFLRGYFDGDGCVSISSYIRKDRNNKNSKTILTGFISGSEKFIKGLFENLKKFTLIKGGTVYYHDRGYRLSFSVKDSLILYGFIYQNTNNLFLTRKKKIFEKYFKIR